MSATMRVAATPLAWIAIDVLLWQTGLGAPLPVFIGAVVAIGMWLILVPPWGMIGYGVRNLLGVVYVVEAIFLIAAAIAHPQPPDGSFGMTTLMLVFAYLGARVIYARLTAPRDGVDLAFPLADARFSVVQGGNDALVNHHVRARAQRYALDIVELGPFGLRAATLVPKRNDEYRIFGCAVHAPCDGTVVAVRDEMEDDGSLAVRGFDVRGNHVVLRRDDGIDVVHAHLQRGSVAVQLGARVVRGTVLGRVGNSGRSSEPHLHIHAERNGQGVPMRFAGRVLERNAIVDARRVPAPA